MAAFADCPAIGALFGAWEEAGATARGCIDRLRASSHGDLPRWLEELGQLPSPVPSDTLLGTTVAVGSKGDLAWPERQRLEAALRGLLPWRKGPFELFGIRIDAEWRSDFKWARVAPHVDLAGRRVLDVGSGNGYYGWRMLEAGAKCVTGVDPSLLYALQHAAVAYYAGRPGNLVLPLRLEELADDGGYDAVFSMGVVYHRRDPAAHVRDLARHARDDATLVLESLLVDGEPLVLEGRYARMRNVWLLPNAALLLSWLADAGFPHAEIVDISTTGFHEQRRTDWMPYHSLQDALDPGDQTRTVEGHPAPKRAIAVACR